MCLLESGCLDGAGVGLNCLFALYNSQTALLINTQDELAAGGVESSGRGPPGRLPGPGSLS